MASNNFDIVDNILRIGAHDYSDSILTAQFRDLTTTVSPITLIYMIYSSILTLPLTKKMQDSNIDAIFVRKVSTNLKIVISYKTVGDGLSLKVVDIDARVTPKFYPMNSILSKNVFQKLKKMKKSTTITPSSFIESIKELHRLTFSFLFDRGPVVIEASTSKQPLEIDPNFLQSSYMPNGFVEVQPYLDRDISLSHYLDQLSSESTSVIKFNGNSLTKILISKLQSGAVGDNPHPSPLTFVEEVNLNPYENIVDALTTMNFVQHSDQLLARFSYCIRRLNRHNPHGFQSFFLGQLMTYKNRAVNKYFFHHEDQHQKSVTSIVFKVRSSENGVLVDMIEPVQNADLLFYSNELVNKIPPLGKLNLKKRRSIP
uniref:Uncharacterized protein n=1 Tax=Romanomermis culicivorax TaxID=13658 RepID=A0A915KXH1_ROMCU